MKMFGMWHGVAAVWVALSCSGAVQGQEMYCGEEDCYYLLGLDRYEYPDSQTIKKAYRKLSRELHPDRNLDDPEAAKKFAQVAVAYETLVDETSREEYHYARDHPEEVFGNSMRFFTRVYAPQMDPTFVVVIMTLVTTGLHWMLMQAQYKRGKNYVKNYHPDFRKKVREMAREQLVAETPSKAQAVNTGTKKKRKDPKTGKKEDIAGELAELEKKIADELIETVDLEGSYKKPVYGDLWVVKLAKLPVVLAQNGYWHFQHSVLGTPLSREEKIELLTDSLGRSQELLLQEFSPTEFDQMLEQECWKRPNFKQFQEEKYKRDCPDRYKQYKRYQKRA
mmetsp:Transcript_12258/g.21871  ORF Transcript_12258/g.21871 Transcript_12258/m.21871 type:complete len:336 (-) Transcript_12258:134-1141(-)|eukprot:CAMPEP_0184543530 /NCGR_PEP_ID=MMETSP0199_2-20130426/2992_1 /TAXON_ID=1112570 /ORGANISM="Thraustochytrium sp., Strain LLF1b" /LENGTH=335 /DNA_ID=CAMNT_0026937567 /DNA_START=99 /DNA_END=1106 /DNA_ORIENTATION=-